MKMKKTLLLLLIATTFLTGCVRENINMSIDKNKKMDLTIILARDMSYTDSKLDESRKLEFEKIGFKVEDYKDDTYVGIKLTKSINSIDSNSKENNITFNLEKIVIEKIETSQLFTNKKNLFGDTYTAKFIYDSNSLSYFEDMFIVEEDVDKDSEEPVMESDTDIDLNNENEDLSDINKYLSNYDLKYIVTLPVVPITNDATTVSDDGKTLTWDLTQSEKTNINYSFEIKNMTNLYIIGGSVIGGLMIILLIISVLVQNSKRRKDLEVEVPKPSEKNSTIVNINTRVENINQTNLNSSLNEMPALNKFGQANRFAHGGGIEPIEKQKGLNYSEEIIPESIPVVPVETITPIESVIPTVPVETITPIENVIPSVPTETITPIESVIPTAPVETITPIENVIPTAPVETITPIESVIPTVPVEPIVQPIIEAPSMEIPIIEGVNDQATLDAEREANEKNIIETPK